MELFSGNKKERTDFQWELDKLNTAIREVSLKIANFGINDDQNPKITRIEDLTTLKETLELQRAVLINSQNKPKK